MPGNIEWCTTEHPATILKLIKEYFANYFLHMSDVTYDIEHNRMEVHQRNAEPWRVTLVDTGEETLTGGRLVPTLDGLAVADAMAPRFEIRPEAGR